MAKTTHTYAATQRPQGCKNRRRIAQYSQIDPNNQN